MKHSHPQVTRLLSRPSLDVLFISEADVLENLIAIGGVDYDVRELPWELRSGTMPHQLFFALPSIFEQGFEKGGLVATIPALEKGNCLCKSKVGVQLNYNLMAALASIPSVVATVIGLSPFSVLIMSSEPN